VLIARRLLEICWTFAGSCKHPISVVSDVDSAEQFHGLVIDSADGDTVTMSAADDCRKVVVSNLPTDMLTVEHITLFFESKTYCPAGGDVVHVEMNASHRTSAVVTFKDRSGNHRLITH